MKVVFVVGPTGSGKSDWALEMARAHRGAIVNCDSIQVFQELNIGSAKPSFHERAQVPHFLYDLVPAGKTLTAGEYSRLFFGCLESLESQFPFVFVVGGTGFYFQAIEKGMYPIGAADEEMKAQVERELQEPLGPQKLHQELLEKDPVTAQRVSINDHYRLGRAIEIIRTHGKSVTAIQQEFQSQQKSFPYPLIKLGLKISKEALLPKIEARTRKMLQAGLVDEVKNLLERGLGDWPPMASVGYKEVVEHLKGTLPGGLQESIVQSTMRLAKKQRTWFQRDPEIHWFEWENRSNAEALLNR